MDYNLDDSEKLKRVNSLIGLIAVDILYSAET